MPRRPSRLFVMLISLVLVAGFVPAHPLAAALQSRAPRVLHGPFLPKQAPAQAPSQPDQRARSSYPPASFHPSFGEQPAISTSVLAAPLQQQLSSECAPGEEVLSKKKHVVVSAWGQNDADNYGRNITDVDLGSWWETGEEDTPTFPQTVLIDLMGEYQITSVKTSWDISGEGTYTPKYKLYHGSTNGTTFSSLLDRSNNATADITTDTFNSTTRYIKVEVTSVVNGFSPHIYDLTVCGILKPGKGQANTQEDCKPSTIQPLFTQSNPRVAAPINTRTGNLWVREHELVVHSSPFYSQSCAAHQLEWTRTYNSSMTDLITGTSSLGYGWQHVYNTRLITESMPGGEQGLVIVVTPHGNLSRFQALTDEGYEPGSFLAMNGVYSTLLHAGDTYTQTLRDNSHVLFDQLGRAKAMIDPQGHRLNLIYNDGKLNVIRDATSSSRALTLTYDITGTHILTVTDGLGRNIRYHYSGDDLASATDEMGRTTTYEYQNHLLTKVMNPLNQVLEQTQYDAYTPAGRAISQTLLSGERYNLLYGTSATTVTVTGPNLTLPITDVFRFNAGDMLKTIHRNGVLLGDVDFDETINPGLYHDGNGNPTESTYTDVGLPLTITNALDQSISAIYDDHNRPITMTDELGRQSRYHYDNQNNVITATTGIVPGFSAGFTTRYTYSTPYAPGSTIRYLEQVQAPDGVVTRYLYNPLVEGQVLTVTAGFGTTAAQTMTYGYDSFGRVLTTTLGVGSSAPVSDVMRYNLDGTLKEFIRNYRGNGSFSEATSDQNVKTFYEYDGLSRLITTTLAYGSSIARKEVLRYNARGQVSERIQNYQDGTFSLASPDQDVKTLYAYDGLDRTSLVTQTAILTGTFDSANRQFSAHTTRVSRYEYDKLSRPVTVTLNYQPSQPIYSANPAAGKPDVNVQLITQYDTQGNVVGQRDGLGRWTRYGFDQLNRVLTTTLNYENGNPLTIDAGNSGWATLNDTDIVSVNVYDPETGLLTRQIDNYVDGTFTITQPITDRINLFEYDLLGRLITTTHNLSTTLGTRTDTNRVSLTQYDSVSRMVGQRDPLGRWVNTQFDMVSRPITTTLNCRSAGGLAVATGCSGFLTAKPDQNVYALMRYDSRGRGFQQVNVLGTVSHTVYDGLSQPIASIQNYVAPGTPTSAITNVTTLQRYDALGRTAVVTDAVGAVTRYVYDGLGRTAIITDALGRDSRSGYDGSGALRWSETLDGRFSVTMVDGLGRVIKSIQNYQNGTFDSGEPADQDLISQMAYDGAGRLLQQTNPAGTITSFSYDLRDQLLKVIENDQASCAGVTTNDCDVPTEYRYDRAGNRIALKDARGNTRRWSYDAANRQVSATDALTLTTAWEYDRLDRLVAQRDPRGSNYDLTYTYDGLDQITQTASLNFTTPITAAYDGLGRRVRLGDSTGLTSFSYDALDRATQVIAPTTGAITNTYNARGERTQLTYPDSTSVLYSYFADGQLKAVTQTNTLLASYSYDSAGRLSQVSRANGATSSYAYDGADRLRALSTQQGGALLSQFDYLTDRVGNRTVLTETLNLTRLTKDIYVGGSAGSFPRGGAVMSGSYYYSASDGTHGRELWKSTGTSAGTSMVKDSYPGSGDGAGTNLAVVGGTLFFDGRSESAGLELWKSDGTESGTLLVKDIASGLPGSSPTSLINVNGTLFFVANDFSTGSELWKSDGTQSGTLLVKDIRAGGASALPTSLTTVNGTLFFAATDAISGTELWKSDGTNAGTVLVKDIHPSGSATPSSLTNVNGTLYFVANNGSSGVELWKSDGTAAGTVLVKDIHTSGNASPTSLTNVNGTLFFAATTSANGVELWKSDGSESGTVLVKDIMSGSGSANPSSLTNVNGTLFFAATTSANGVELWKSDGSESGTVLVKDIVSGTASSVPANLLHVNGLLFFTATDGSHHIELWTSDGSASGTAMLKDIRAGMLSSAPGFLVAAGGALYFEANDGTAGQELWISDGTAAGTSLVQDSNSHGASSGPTGFLPIGNQVYFAANDGSDGGELWKSDGSESGTQRVKDSWAGEAGGGASWLTNLNGTLLFVTSNGSDGGELWKSDGSESGTLLVKDIASGAPGSNPANLVPVNGTLFLSASTVSNGNELWKSDGTESGTTLVKDIRAGAASAAPSSLTNLSGTLLFAATDAVSGTELWKSDGTTAGTVLVKDIHPSGSANPTSLTNVNGTLFFAATDAVSGTELWKSDGTTAGTVLVKDIHPSGSANPTSLTNVNGTLYFVATTSANGVELWKSDGTTSGTVLVKDIVSGSGSASPLGLVVLNGTLYFSAAGSGTGRELWKSDGSESGTLLVKDIASGILSSVPTNLAVAHGMLYFQATDNSSGLELWQSDGSESGTVLAKDIKPGGGHAAPVQLTAFNELLVFSAESIGEGRELWSKAPGSWVTRSTYDDLSRLTHAHESGVGASTYYSYTYDLAGNRTSSKKNAEATVSLSYNAADRVSNAGWSYDSAGNLLADGSSSFTYDALGRLLTATSAGTTITNTYNGDGVLVRQQLGASSYTTYTQDLVSPLSQVLQQQVGTTTTNYLYGHERLASVTSGTRSWHHADALGSLRMTTTDLGMPRSVPRFDPFGTPVGDAPAPFGFAGELFDSASGLAYHRARWYRPATGTFLGKDPFAGIPTTPYSQHYYQYAYANPVLHTDPSGRAVLPPYRPPADTSENNCLKNPFKPGYWTDCEELFGCPPMYVDPDLPRPDLGLDCIPLTEPQPEPAPSTPTLVDCNNGTVNASDPDPQDEPQGRQGGNTGAGGSPTPSLPLLDPSQIIEEDGFVYRALRETENPSAGLKASVPHATNSPLDHITMGYNTSRWISTTKDPSVAINRYDKGYGIVKIELSKVSDTILDLSNGDPKWGTKTGAWRMAIRDKEVLIEKFIPLDAIIGWVKLPK